MKKILLSVLALLAFTGSGTSQNLPSYVPANGLVGWWPFNGNANDESGNNNNGTVNGATLTTDRFGNAGKAYKFDQANQNSITGSLPNFSPNSFSVSLWGKHKTGQTGNSPINGNQPFEWLFGVGLPTAIAPTSEALILGVYNNTSAISTGSWGNQFTTGATIDTVWKNYVITYENSLMKVYQGSALVSTNPINFNFSSYPFCFGRQLMGINEFWNGSLDDIAIYNRALTQQEITALYQGANTTANCPQLPANLQQGLVGYWPFCGNALDESGNNNHGTVNGATLTTDRFGNAGAAYGFNGVNNFIQVSDDGDSTLDLTRNFSVSVWAQFDSLIGNGPTMLSKHIGNLDNMGSYEFIAGKVPSDEYKLSFQATPNFSLNAYSNFSSFSKNVWVNYSVTYDYLGENLFYYVNGIQVDSIHVNFDISNTDIDFLIGCTFLNNTSTYDYFWKGTLDDIAIWNRALSQSEITQLYNQGICQTSITVTDTLLIHTGITSYNPVAYQNTLKVWPNPGNQDITLDAGNLSLMQGWKIKISNSLGQEVYPATLISQQQQVLDMSAWGGNGLYLLHLINPQGHITEVKKIVLAP